MIQVLAVDPNTQNGSADTTMTMILVGAVIALLLTGIISYDYQYAQRVAQEQQQVANRSEAKNLLMEVAKRQEAYFQKHKRYTTELDQLGYSDVEDWSVASPSGLYKVVVTSADDRTFTLVAEPQGDQLSDSKCGAFTYDKKGTAKSARGSDSTACW
ncbi:MAG: type IV pilin protein [Magnetococcales bacterium]|nr:type IV pilin protein [Magnetococcales bacterium]